MMGALKRFLGKAWKWHKSFLIFMVSSTHPKNVWLAQLIRKAVWVYYLYIVIDLKPKIGYSTIFYDMHHNEIFLGFVCIAWGSCVPLGKDKEGDTHWVFPERFR